MPKIECKLCKYECKKGKRSLVGDDPKDFVVVIIDSVEELLYPMGKNPQGVAIVNGVVDSFQEYYDRLSPNTPSGEEIVSSSKGVCEISGYSVGITTSKVVKE